MFNFIFVVNIKSEDKKLHNSDQKEIIKSMLKFKKVKNKSK